MAESLGEAILDLGVDQTELDRGLREAEIKTARAVAVMQAQLNTLHANVSTRMAMIGPVVERGLVAPIERFGSATALTSGEVARAVEQLGAMKMLQTGAAVQQALPQAPVPISGGVGGGDSGHPEAVMTPPVYGIKGPKAGGSLINPVVVVIEAASRAGMSSGMAAAMGEASAAGTTQEKAREAPVTIQRIEPQPVGLSVQDSSQNRAIADLAHSLQLLSAPRERPALPAPAESSSAIALLTRAIADETGRISLGKAATVAGGLAASELAYHTLIKPQLRESLGVEKPELSVWKQMLGLRDLFMGQRGSLEMPSILYHGTRASPEDILDKGLIPSYSKAHEVHEIPPSIWLSAAEGYSRQYANTGGYLFGVNPTMVPHLVPEPPTNLTKERINYTTPDRIPSEALNLLPVTQTDLHPLQVRAMLKVIAGSGLGFEASPGAATHDANQFIIARSIQQAQTLVEALEKVLPHATPAVAKAQVERSRGIYETIRSPRAVWEPASLERLEAEVDRKLEFKATKLGQWWKNIQAILGGEGGSFNVSQFLPGFRPNEGALYHGSSSPIESIFGPGLQPGRDPSHVGPRWQESMEEWERIVKKIKRRAFDEFEQMSDINPGSAKPVHGFTYEDLREYGLGYELPEKPVRPVYATHEAHATLPYARELGYLYGIRNAASLGFEQDPYSPFQHLSSRPIPPQEMAIHPVTTLAMNNDLARQYKANPLDLQSLEGLGHREIIVLMQSLDEARAMRHYLGEAGGMGFGMGHLENWIKKVDLYMQAQQIGQQHLVAEMLSARYGVRGATGALERAYERDPRSPSRDRGIELESGWLEKEKARLARVEESQKATPIRDFLKRLINDEVGSIGVGPSSSPYQRALNAQKHAEEFEQAVAEELAAKRKARDAADEEAKATRQRTSAEELDARRRDRLDRQNIHPRRTVREVDELSDDEIAKENKRLAFILKMKNAVKDESGSVRIGGSDGGESWWQRTLARLDHILARIVDTEYDFGKLADRVLEGGRITPFVRESAAKQLGKTEPLTNHEIIKESIREGTEHGYINIQRREQMDSMKEMLHDLLRSERGSIEFDFERLATKLLHQESITPKERREAGEALGKKDSKGRPTSAGDEEIIKRALGEGIRREGSLEREGLRAYDELRKMNRDTLNTFARALGLKNPEGARSKDELIGRLGKNEPSREELAGAMRTVEQEGLFTKEIKGVTGRRPISSAKSKKMKEELGLIAQPGEGDESTLWDTLWGSGDAHRRASSVYLGSIGAGPLRMRLGGGGSGKPPDGGILRTALWGSGAPGGIVGSAYRALPAVGLASLAGLGFERVPFTAAALAGSGASAIGGAGLALAGNVGRFAVGAGSDLAVLKSTISDTKQLGEAYTQVQKAVALYGAGSNQAVQAQKELSIKVKELSGGLSEQAAVGVKAELRLSKEANKLNEFWDRATQGARVQAANVLSQVLHLGTSYVPLVAKAAETNLAIINTHIKPLFSWLEGSQGKGIFLDLEKQFAERLPQTIHAFTQAVEFLLKTVDVASHHTGGFIKSLDDFFTKWNKAGNFAIWEGEIGKLIDEFRLWWKFIKLVGDDLYLLFKNDAGLGKALIETFNHMLENVKSYEEGTEGKEHLKTIFGLHKEEVLALIHLIPLIIDPLAKIYLQVAPPLIKVVTVLAEAIGKVVKGLQEISPAFSWLIGGGFILAKLGLLSSTVSGIARAFGLIGPAAKKASAETVASAETATGALTQEEIIAQAAGPSGIRIGKTGEKIPPLTRLGTKAEQLLPLLTRGAAIAGGSALVANTVAGAAGAHGTLNTAITLGSAGAGAGFVLGPAAAAALGTAITPVIGTAIGAGIGFATPYVVKFLGDVFGSHSKTYGEKFAEHFTEGFGGPLGAEAKKVEKEIANAYNKVRKEKGKVEELEKVYGANPSGEQKSDVESHQSKSYFNQIHLGDVVAKGLALSAQPAAESGHLFASTLVRNFQKEFQVLPTWTKEEGAKQMVEWARSLEKNGQLPKGSVKRLVTGIIHEFPQLEQYLNSLGYSFDKKLSAGMKFEKTLGAASHFLSELNSEFDLGITKIEANVKTLPGKIGEAMQDIRAAMHESHSAKEFDLLDAKFKELLQWEERIKKTGGEAIKAHFHLASTELKHLAPEVQKGGKAWEDYTNKIVGQLSDASEAIGAFPGFVHTAIQHIGKELETAFRGLGVEGQDAESLVTGNEPAGGFKLSNPFHHGSSGGAPLAHSLGPVLAGGALFQIGTPGDSGHDTIPMNIGGQNVIVGSGEQAAVFNRHQQAVLNDRLADVGGLEGFFNSVNTPHYMAVGGSLKKGAELSARSEAFPGPKGRVDQGVDWAGPGPVKALLPGHVVELGLWHGWPGSGGIVYDTPKGNIYVMEAFKPSPGLRVGSPIRMGQVIGQDLGGATGIEAGWANASATGPLVPYGGLKDGTPTKGGLSFASFVGGGPGGGVGAAAWQDIKTPHIKGKGAIAEIARAGIRKVAQAANKYGQEHSGAIGGIGSGWHGSWVQVMAQIAQHLGWSLSDWKQVVEKESGGIVSNKSPISDAFGLGQLKAENYNRLGGGPGSSGVQQIEAMARYIKERYGNPTGALAAEHSKGYYAKGGIVVGGKAIKPPHLRTATGAQSCGNCKMFNKAKGECWGYGNHPVQATQTCDSWSRSGYAQGGVIKAAYGLPPALRHYGVGGRKPVTPHHASPSHHSTTHSHSSHPRAAKHSKKPSFGHLLEHLGSAIPGFGPQAKVLKRQEERFDALGSWQEDVGGMTGNAATIMGSGIGLLSPYFVDGQSLIQAEWLVPKGERSVDREILRLHEPEGKLGEDLTMQQNILGYIGGLDRHRLITQGGSGTMRAFVKRLGEHGDPFLSEHPELGVIGVNAPVFQSELSILEAQKNVEGLLVMALRHQKDAVIKFIKQRVKRREHLKHLLKLAFERYTRLKERIAELKSSRLGQKEREAKWKEARAEAVHQAQMQKSAVGKALADERALPTVEQNQPFIRSLVHQDAELGSFVTSLSGPTGEALRTATSAVQMDHLHRQLEPIENTLHDLGGSKTEEGKAGKLGAVVKQIKALQDGANELDSKIKEGVETIIPGIELSIEGIKVPLQEQDEGIVPTPQRKAGQSEQQTELTALYRQQAETASLALAVSQKQYKVLSALPPFGGHFLYGGVVPGPIGSSKLIEAHGGETVTPAGGGKEQIIQVIVEDGAVDSGKIKVIANGEAVKVQRTASRNAGRTLPGRGGGLAP